MWPPTSAPSAVLAMKSASRDALVPLITSGAQVKSFFLHYYPLSATTNELWRRRNWCRGLPKRQRRSLQVVSASQWRSFHTMLLRLLSIRSWMSSSLHWRLLGKYWKVSLRYRMRSWVSLWLVDLPWFVDVLLFNVNKPNCPNVKLRLLVTADTWPVILLLRLRSALHF